VRCGWERTARKRIIVVVDKDTKEEIMTANVIEATMGNGSLAVPGGAERTLLHLLAARDARGELHPLGRRTGAP
jgi:hypothetical protein